MRHRRGTRARLLGPLALVVALAGCATAGTPAPSLAAVPASTPSSTPSSTSASVPISGPLSSGDDGLRLYAQVTVGGAPLRVLVDTGSTGLRVVESKVPAAATAPAGPAGPTAYGSGVQITGTVARTSVALGPVTSPGPVPVELVTGTSCLPRRPRCGAADGRTPPSFGGQFDGILGIAPGFAPQVPNPLWYLGAVGHVYTIHHDPAGGDALVLGDPATGYTLEHLSPEPRTDRLPDGPPPWRSRIDVCFDARPLPAGHVCSPTLLDTGTPSLATINAPGAASAVPAGTALHLGTPGAWSVDYTVGPADAAQVAPPPSGNQGSVIGLPAFARADVRFDLDAGSIGIRAR